MGLSAFQLTSNIISTKALINGSVVLCRLIVFPAFGGVPHICS